MSDSLESIGSAFSSRYTIERELGAGGMATVYLAEDVKFHPMAEASAQRALLGLF